MYAHTMRMGNLNLYIRDTDQPLFARLKTMLQNEGRSTAEFFAEAAAQYVDSRTKAEPGEIELLGFGPKRVFTGRTLYRHQTRDDDLGVFLTAKGSIAYWYCCPG